MKFFQIFVFTFLFFSVSAETTNKQYYVAFSNTIENAQDVKSTIESCKGVISVTYCSDAKAYKVTVDSELYKVLESFEIYVRPNLEKITTNKFYFSELTNSHFSNLNCN